MTTCTATLHAADGDHECILDADHVLDPESVTHRDADGVEWSCAFDVPPM